MNCKQVRQLMPLYVGGDLEERRELLIAAHEQSCPDCAGAVDEYRQSRQLLQEFTPPPFNEGVFAEIRKNVWRRIEAESAAPTMSEVIANSFRPRLTWAFASALLIGVFVLGIYFIGNRWTIRQQVSVKASETDRNRQNDQAEARFGSIKAAASSFGKGTNEQQQAANRQRPQRHDRKVTPDRANALAVNSLGALSSTAAASSSLKNSGEPDSSPVKHSEKAVRMEIQTRDPNIRIIWFSRQDTKRVSPNSRGI